LRLVCTALDLHAQKTSLDQIAQQLGVTFGTVAAWIYHPQNQGLRAEALARSAQKKEPRVVSSLTKALAAYDHGLSFDAAARAGHCEPEALKKALQARRASKSVRQTHFHYR